MAWKLAAEAHWIAIVPDFMHVCGSANRRTGSAHSVLAGAESRRAAQARRRRSHGRRGIGQKARALVPSPGFRGFAGYLVG